MTDFLQLPSGLVVPMAALAEDAKVDREGRPVMGEIATSRDGRDITQGYVDALPYLPPSDTELTLGIAGGAYSQVLRDDKVAADMASRALALIAREWEVRPGGKRAIDRKAADSLEAQLKALEWDRISRQQLWTNYWGFGVAEAIYQRDGREIVLGALKVRDRLRFAFGPDLTGPAGGLKLLISSNPMGEDLPARKFWLARAGGDHDDLPYGRGLAWYLFWPAFFKRHGIKFWAGFLEKFAAPTGVGYFPRNAQPSDQQRLLRAIEAIQRDAAIILPEGMRAELLEATRGGTVDYSGWVDHWDRAIARLILGHTAGSDSTAGKLGGEDMATEVRGDLVKADADLLSGSFNSQIAKWLTEWNYPGAATPEVWRLTEDPEDQDAAADRDTKLWMMGWEPTEERIKDVYGEGYQRRTSMSVAPGPDGQPPALPAPEAQGAAFAESMQAAAFTPARRDPVDAQTEQLGREAEVHIQAILDRVRTLMAEVDAAGGTLADVRDRLLDLYPQIDPRDLGELLAAGFAAADLGGRYDMAVEGGTLPGSIGGVRS